MTYEQWFHGLGAKLEPGMCACGAAQGQPCRRVQCIRPPADLPLDDRLVPIDALAKRLARIFSRIGGGESLLEPEEAAIANEALRQAARRANDIAYVDVDLWHLARAIAAIGLVRSADAAARAMPGVDWEALGRE